jgi:hypothetical protein
MIMIPSRKARRWMLTSSVTNADDDAGSIISAAVNRCSIPYGDSIRGIIAVWANGPRSLSPAHRAGYRTINNFMRPNGARYSPHQRGQNAPLALGVRFVWTIGPGFHEIRQPGVVLFQSPQAWPDVEFPCWIAQHRDLVTLACHPVPPFGSGPDYGSGADGVKAANSATNKPLSNYLNQLERETGFPIVRGQRRRLKTDGLQTQPLIHFTSSINLP